METSNRKKYWVSVSATIVLGALGSGLWNLVEPSIERIGNWILSVATLGIKSIQDDEYANAALGLHELASLYILLMASAFIFTMPGIIAATPLILSAFKKVMTGNEQLNEKVLSGNQRKRAFKLLLTVTLFGTLTGSYFIVKFLIVNQENLIASYFRQRVTVIRPYISDADFNSYNSAFARLKSKEDYLALMERMKGVGKANGIEVPKAETW
ncbi:hypothetical protein [Pseudoduganella namucuonensis]|uniref:Uncharacterized protein n=1 Tax=Pseudoduganella namucuonensis TaxID=1035707 RepID=A0A1I7JMZ9_9BURK|nr:hypothetical protein [Pseudoduganella namucuonensis]SFU86528.1 hypothetical protein SAMN05216552_101272 [Pseudoduganella namucuonensis]